MLPKQQRTYLRWDNINYYVPAKKHEVRMFEEGEEQRRMQKITESDGSSKGGAIRDTVGRNIVKEAKSGKIVK